MYCQLVNICGCIPACIRNALADLPETLDGTYERTLREIKKANWEFAHRLLQFVAVAIRPLRVEELAELLAFDFKAGSIPKFHEDWRLVDPIHAVLSTCPSFLAIVDENYPGHKVVQFSHFSVKEFLTSARLAKSNDIILRRYHISETPAHTVAARACLGYLLHLDKDVTRYSLRNLPFAEYSAEYWVSHARVEDVSQNVKDGLKELFDQSKPHLAICIWICDPSLSSWEMRQSEWCQSERPSRLRKTPLQYVVFWDLHSIVELLVNEHSQDVNSRDFNDATPLHLASEIGRLEVARTLIEHGARVSARNKDGWTPLHLASQEGRLEVAHMLIEHGADVSAQNFDGQTPLHLVSPSHRNRVQFHGLVDSGRPQVAQMLIKHGADVSAQDKVGEVPLHRASQAGWLGVARILIELGADVSVHNKDGQTPVHLAVRAGQLEVARILIECGTSVSARNKDGHTPLHLASKAGWLEVARMIIERGADVSAQDKDGQTPVHLALQCGRLGVARMLIKHGASVSAPGKYGRTPLHLVSLRNLDWVPNPYLDSTDSDRPEVARMLIELGANVLAQDKDGQTPVHLALREGRLEVARMLIEHSASVPAQNKDGTPLHMAYLGDSDFSEVPPMFSEPGTDVSTQNEDWNLLQYPGNLDEDFGSFEFSEVAPSPMFTEPGADVSAQKEDGTPFHMAYLRNPDPIFDSFNFSEVAPMFTEPGADVPVQKRTREGCRKGCEEKEDTEEDARERTTRKA